MNGMPEGVCVVDRNHGLQEGDLFWRGQNKVDQPCTVDKMQCVINLLRNCTRGGWLMR